MTARFVIADVFDSLASLEPDSVDLIVTSPPFLALRSYLPADHEHKAKELGSEATPGEFIDRLLDVVEACDRVLAPHGSLVFELGDTYAGSGGAGGDYDADGLRGGQPLFTGSAGRRAARTASPRLSADGIDFNGARRHEDADMPKKGAGWPLDKSKVLIPQLFAIALAYGFNPLTGRQTEPWRVRNTVAFCRPNPPVGRDGDKFRPATSFLTIATKARDRYWDGDAVRTDVTRDNRPSSPRRTFKDANDRYHGNGEFPPSSAGAPLLDYWVPLANRIDAALREAAQGSYTQEDLWGETSKKSLNTKETLGSKLLREAAAGNEIDMGDALILPTKGYPGAHYATYPPDLVVPLVKAMCPAKVCRVCGKPSTRITEATYSHDASHANGTFGGEKYVERERTGNAQEMSLGCANKSVTTLGWSDCGHDDDYRPGMVLDPFAGSGTTLAVASGHGFDCIGLDLDSRNADLARERCGMFLEVETLPAELRTAREA